MSLIPLFFNDNWYSSQPTRLMNQHFGLGLDLDDLSTRGFRTICPAIYYRPWRSAASQKDSGSVVSTNEDGFEVKLDVEQFKPEEITVKVTGKNTVTIEGKHKEKQDEHGFISRHFVRKYVLPEGHDMTSITSNLSSDGVLSIAAPRIEESGTEHRSIPIQETGEPAKAIKTTNEE